MGLAITIILTATALNRMADSAVQSADSTAVVASTGDLVAHAEASAEAAVNLV
jgi:hypothetical protein